MSSVAPPARMLAERRLAGPAAMLFFCLCGMAVGLAIDCGNVPSEVLASLCLAPSDSPLATFANHVTLLPATHLLMIAGGGVAVALGENGGPRPTGLARMAIHVATLVLMLAGMAGLAWLVPALGDRFGLAPGFAGLAAAMVAGMTLGMTAAMPLHWRRSRRL